MIGAAHVARIVFGRLLGSFGRQRRIIRGAGALATLILTLRLGFRRANVFLVFTPRRLAKRRAVKQAKISAVNINQRLGLARGGVFRESLTTWRSAFGSKPSFLASA